MLRIYCRRYCRKNYSVFGNIPKPWGACMRVRRDIDFSPQKNRFLLLIIKKWLNSNKHTKNVSEESIIMLPLRNG